MNEGANACPIKADLGLGGAIRIDSRQIAVADAKLLLEAIVATGSVQGVAEALGLSYRAAWDRLQEFEAAFGRQLVKKTRGHGSTLTETGAALLEALARASSGLEVAFARETRALNLRLAGLHSQSMRLNFAVSHDLLLMEGLAAWGNGEVAVVGSGEALARLAAGRVDAAGFHCGPLEPAKAGPPFAEFVDNADFVVRPLFEREQGFLLARGNPLGVAGLADLAGGKARYVNRQSGSGTRTWFDRMLAEAGVRPTDIAGYELEEFTHHAIAAVIASGAADAGLGARAAAERFGLDFLPVGWETYYLASVASLPEGALDVLVADVAQRAAQSSGYR